MKNPYQFSTHYYLWECWTGLFIACLLSVYLGAVRIPISEIIAILYGNASKESWRIIILDYRLPKTITAILTGSGLAVCGLIMQTFFRNTLAGPFVLGISSGASLGVALLIFGASFFGFSAISNVSLSTGAIIGALSVFSLIILVSNKVQKNNSILIIGLMFSSFSSAVISVLSYVSSAEKIRQFVFWNFGNIANLNWTDLYFFIGIYVLCFIALLLVIKPLNAFLLGFDYAKSTGINIRKSKNLIIVITSVLTGAIIAFVGPIAFVGVAVPHIAKRYYKTTNHKILLLASALIGAIVVLVCDSIAQISGNSLPINAVTSLFGTPIIIWLILKNDKK